MSDEIAQLALQLGARLSPESCGVIFFGGEPLLFKDRIYSIVNAAEEMRRRGEGSYHFKVTTNGLLLDEAFLRFSMKHNLMIAMSFDGLRAAHDRFRRLPAGGGTFDILLARLRALLAVRPYSSVMMTVNPETVSYLAQSVEYLVDEGCRFLIVSLNYEANWTERELEALEKQMQRLARLYIRWTGKGRKFYLSPFEVKLSSHINRHCYRKDRCELAERQISVDPEGYLYPCVQFPKAGPRSEWCIGHVSTGINEEARNRIRDESQREKSTCRDCAIQDRCNSTCGCLNWQTTGSINAVSPVLCRYEQMMIPIADRVGRILYRQRNPRFLHKHYNAGYPILSLLEDTLADTPRADQPEPPGSER